ncbi:site-specific integrase [uncultured Vibrio sp.]|uniref:site-specific integrase n=1 Tax=uncultured Vibrio sp. TaxID=114054 RepID=UPI002AAB1DDE|nr:site-specific integrase [uncultured Vibrio sp.]
MAVYIETNFGKKGTTYKVRYRNKQKNKCKTFNNIVEAERYAKKLKNLSATIIKDSSTKLTVGEVIQSLLANEKTKEAMKGAISNLKMLLNYDIALIRTNELRASDLINHCQQRQSDLTQPSPATLYHDITNIISALKLGKSLHNLNIDISGLIEGKSALYKLKLISSSTPRSRRPESEEITQILDLAADIQNNTKTKLPILDISDLALETAMRRGEITKVKWGDYNPKKATLIIRDRKHPTRPSDHHIWLSPKAIEIVERQTRGLPNEPIFPFSPSSITMLWGKMCKQLCIKDLHFHDLRSEAACRYYLQHWDIVRIAKQTGHKDLNTLNNFYLRLGLTDRQLLKKNEHNPKN